MMTYTREELIEICEKAIVPMPKWRDRDSCSAQIQVGKAWALLKTQAEFSAKVEDGTIWIEFFHLKDFQYFEIGDQDGYETAYLPTPSTLEKSSGHDWY